MAVAETEIVSSPSFFATQAVPQLTLKQKLFIQYYLQHRNGTMACQLAGYSGDDNALAVQSNANLRNPKIRAEIMGLLNPIASANETLARLTHHSRSSIADILDDNGSFDLKTAKANHADDLIKKLKVKRRTFDDGSVEVSHELELHDAQAATVHLAKHHGLLMDRSENVNVNIELTGADLSLILADALSEAIDVTPETGDNTSR